MTAEQFAAGLTLLPFREGATPVLHVLAPSSRRRDLTDAGGLTFARLTPSVSGGSLSFDTFHASRQVRLPDDRFYARGHAAALFDRGPDDRVLVLLGVDRGGSVYLRWRRSE